MIQDRRECFVCGRWTGLEEHHIFFGRNRKNSDEDGLTCWLCYEHHRGPQGVHHNRALDLRLKRIGQFIYEQSHTREEFMRRYGRNYDEGPEGTADHIERAEVVEAEDQDHQGPVIVNERGAEGDADAKGAPDAMSDYYPKKSGLPRDVYNSVLWLVRGYERKKDELDALITQSKSEEPRGAGRSDPTVQAAIRREKLRDDVQSVEGALMIVPEEYRSIVYENIRDTRPFRTFPAADYAHYQTWKHWRRQFMVEVARRKGWYA